MALFVCEQLITWFTACMWRQRRCGYLYGLVYRWGADS